MDDDDEVLIASFCLIFGAFLPRMSRLHPHVDNGILFVSRNTSETEIHVAIFIV